MQFIFNEELALIVRNKINENFDNLFSVVQPINALTQTWNNPNTSYSAINLFVTDEASHDSSKLLNLSINNTSRFSVDKFGGISSNFNSSAPSQPFNIKVDGVSLETTDILGNKTLFGNLTFNGINPRINFTTNGLDTFIKHNNTNQLDLGVNNATQLRISTESVLLFDCDFGWATTKLSQDAPNTLAQRNSTNPQKFNIYNTYIDENNYERGFIGWNTNTLEIGTEAAGSGSARNISLLSSLVTSTGIFSLTPTWNNAGTIFKALNIEVTDTASNIDSMLLDLQTNGARRIAVPKNIGAVYFGSADAIQTVGGRLDFCTNNYTSVRASVGANALILTGRLDFGGSMLGSNSGDLQLNREAADALSLRRSTNPQSFYISNTYIDKNNYERGFMRWNSNALEIGTEAAGTGISRDIFIVNEANLRFISTDGSISFYSNGSGTTFGWSISAGTLSSLIHGTGDKTYTIKGFDTDLAGNRGVCSLIVRGGNANPYAESAVGQGSMGGNLSLLGGNGASAALGNAHGGNVIISGGPGYGTGRYGYVQLQNLPTTDPTTANTLWNNGGLIVLSDGSTFSGFTKSQGFKQTALTDATNIDWDLNLNQATTITLNGNRTLNNPTNMVAGYTYILIVKQDGVGGRTLTYGNNYKWPGGTAPVLTAAPNSTDIITFISDGTNLYGVSSLNFQ